MTTLYGIPNCDQLRKARAWLDRHTVSYAFHDFRKSGIMRQQIDLWLQDIEWEILLNRKSSTWRTLSNERKTAINDASSATSLMLEAPSIIKRPVLVLDGRTYVGFDEVTYQRIFNK